MKSAEAWNEAAKIIIAEDGRDCIDSVSEHVGRNHAQALLHLYLYMAKKCDLTGNIPPDPDDPQRQKTIEARLLLKYREDSYHDPMERRALLKAVENLSSG